MPRSNVFFSTIKANHSKVSSPEILFPGSVTYLNLMKSKGLGELCAATSDLANQTGSEKNSSFDHPQAELDILISKNGLWKPEARNLTHPSFLCLAWLPATLMILSKMNEPACRHNFPIISPWEMF